MGFLVQKSAGYCAATIGVLLLAGAQARAQSITDKLGNWLFGTYSAPAESGNSANTVAEVDCPGVTVRQGASTLAITEPGAEAGPMTTRYQVSIAQTARECAPLGSAMTMKVGVQGRILLGPAGGPGQLDVPLRSRRLDTVQALAELVEDFHAVHEAVVQEGPNPKTILSKFYKLAVAIPPGQTSVPFVHVEQDLTFPTPRAADFDSYVVYVGFDPQSLNTKPERPAKKPRKK